MIADRLQRFAQQHQPFLLDVDDARAARPDLLPRRAAQVHEKHRGDVPLLAVPADVHELRGAGARLPIDQRFHRGLDVHFLAVGLAAHPPQRRRADAFEVATDQADHASVPAARAFEKPVRSFRRDLLDDAAPVRAVVLNPAVPFVIEKRPRSGNRRRQAARVLIRHHGDILRRRRRPGLSLHRRRHRRGVTQHARPLLG